MKHSPIFPFYSPPFSLLSPVFQLSFHSSLLTVPYLLFTVYYSPLFRNSQSVRQTAKQTAVEKDGGFRLVIFNDFTQQSAMLLTNPQSAFCNAFPIRNHQSKIRISFCSSALLSTFIYRCLFGVLRNE
jgi:hypothetical protein